MKVLFSVPRYHPNHDGLVIGLTEAGHSVAFLVHGTHPTEHHVEGVSVTVVERSRVLPFLGRGRGKRWHQNVLPSLRFLYRYLGRTRPDLVVARDMNSTNYLLFLMCRLFAIDYLLYTQSRMGYEPMRPKARWLLPWGLWPRHTINTTVREPTQVIPGKTYDFIPFSVGAYDYAKQDYPTGFPLRLFALGKFDQSRKNHTELVQSLGPLLREGKLRLTILGLREGPVAPAFQRLLDEIERQGVGDKVALVENLPYEESRRLFENHDLFVMVSSREGAGISPAEALTTGLPVIVGSDNGTNYFVEDGYNGFVFRDMDFEAFVMKVRHFVDNPSEVERMGRNARRLMLEKYSPADFERRFTDLVGRRFPHLTAGAGRTALPVRPRPAAG